MSIPPISKGDILLAISVISYHDIVKKNLSQPPFFRKSVQSNSLFPNWLGRAAPLEERSQEAAAFLRWVLSPEGQTLVEQTGYTAIQP